MAFCLALNEHSECDVLRCRKHSFIHSIWQADLFM
jgi:hypothetical protein